MDYQEDWEYAAYGVSPEAGRKSAPQSVEEKPLSVKDAVDAFNALMKKQSFLIEGEVSAVGKPGYANFYFDIKDESCSLSCKMWANAFKACNVTLEPGAKVIVKGTFECWGKKGSIEFRATKVVLAGDGFLRQQVAQLIERLSKEGLTSQERKRPIPYCPMTIGVVTSPRGAVIHDVRRTLNERFPLAKILFAGVQVEGKNAPQDMIKAMNVVANAGAEVVLLVRGGGSFEDMMPFNDESLARAIVQMPVPVVTGIGHEPDTSVADLVADLRASTPTRAAMEVSLDQVELRSSLDTMVNNATERLRGRLNRSAQIIASYESRPLFSDPMYLFSSDAQTLDSLQAGLERLRTGLVQGFANDVRLIERHQAFSNPKTLYDRDAQLLGTLQASMIRLRGTALKSFFNEIALAETHSVLSDPRRLYQDASSELTSQEASLKRIGTSMLASYERDATLKRDALKHAYSNTVQRFCNEAAVTATKFESLSPIHTLARGWSMTRDEQGHVVKSVSQVSEGDVINLRVSDGAIRCRAEEVSELSALVSLEV